MAKLTCLLALFVATVLCAEAVRIDPPTAHANIGKQFSSVYRSDPRCPRGKNELYPDPKNSKKYIKCNDGKGREMVCPDDFEFDSALKTCVSPDQAVSGRTGHSGSSSDKEICPSTYGYFPFPSDCHKFIVCVDGQPSVRECEENTYYNDNNGGCIPGDCPKESASKRYKCRKMRGNFPDEKDCTKYIKCMNWVPDRKQCPSGRAFDPHEQTCTKEQLERCKNNDIWSLGHDDDEYYYGY